MTPVPTCETCQFARQAGTVMWCQRFPPQIKPSTSDFATALNAAFPVVASEWWCGEYEMYRRRDDTKHGVSTK